MLDQLLAHISTISLGIRVSVILLTFYVLHVYGMAIGVVARSSMVRDYL